MKEFWKPLFMGVDIGTQSVKVCIFDSEGMMLAKHSERQYMHVPASGWAVESPGLWWDLIVKSICELGKNPAVSLNQIRAVGVDAVMHSPVAVGPDGNLVEEEVQLYCDKRTGGLVEDLGKEYASAWYQNLTGNPFAPHLMGIKIKWIKEHCPEKYEKTCKFVSAKDYINYRLTGEIATDYSEASGTGVFDRKKADWSEEAVSLLGLDKEKLPHIYESHAVIGTITAEAADETGLPAGIKVVCGGGDMLCALYGSGMVKKGFGFDVTGTGSIVGFYNQEPVLNTDITNVRHVIKGWTPYCCIDSSGGGLRWARDVLCKKEIEGIDGDGYEYLSEQAGRVPHGAEGVLFFPYLQGLRQMELNHAKGVFFGITPATSTEHLIRAVMEGVAFEHQRYYEEFEKYDVINTVIHTGGASNSPLWSQIKADIYDKEIVVPIHDECTALGAAMLAMTGTGVYKNEIEAAKITVGKYKERYEPFKDTQSRYREMFEVFKEINQALKKPFQNMSKIK